MKNASLHSVGQTQLSSLGDLWKSGLQSRHRHPSVPISRCSGYHLPESATIRSHPTFSGHSAPDLLARMSLAFLVTSRNLSAQLQRYWLQCPPELANMSSASIWALGSLVSSLSKGETQVVKRRGDSSLAFESGPRKQREPPEVLGEPCTAPSKLEWVPSFVKASLLPSLPWGQ